MDDNFVIKQDLSIAEYLRVTFYLMARMKIMKRLFIFLSIVGLLRGFLEFSLSNQNKGNVGSVLLEIIMLPGFLFLFVIIFSTLFVLLFYKLKPQWFKGTQYRFNHWGMQKTGKGIDFSAPWSKFVKYTESSQFMFLFLNDKHSFVIQKRMFENISEFEAFRSLIKEKIDS